jgi:hypothetical protein
METGTSEKRHGARLAPIVILGCMFAIGASGITIIAVSQCNRKEKLMDPHFMPKDDPHRLDYKKP